MILGGIGGFVILSAIEGVQVYMTNKFDPSETQQAPPIPGGGQAPIDFA